MSVMVMMSNYLSSESSSKAALTFVATEGSSTYSPAVSVVLLDAVQARSAAPQRGQRPGASLMLFYDDFRQAWVKFVMICSHRNTKTIRTIRMMRPTPPPP